MAGAIAYDAVNHLFTVTGSNTYAEEGSHAVSVTIHDVGGATAIAVSSATVADAALTAQGVNLSTVEGQAFSGIVATFIDANPSATPGDFTATIAWGDGQTSAGALAYDAVNHLFTVTGSNTYAEEGSHAVSVTIHDVGGATAVAVSSATVADAALTARGRRSRPLRGRPSRRGRDVHRCEPERQSGRLHRDDRVGRWTDNERDGQRGSGGRLVVSAATRTTRKGRTRWRSRSSMRGDRRSRRWTARR